MCGKIFITQLRNCVMLVMPLRLTSFAYIRSAGGVCAAGRLDGAYWLIGPGSAGLAQRCRCTLPLQASAGAYCGGRPPAYCLFLHCLRFGLYRRPSSDEDLR